MELILLGTKGGPRLSATHCGPGQVVIDGDRVVLIDAGQGVPQQLLRADIDPADVTDVLITHHHSDHNVSLGSVLMAAWAHGRSAPITVWGPPPLSRLAHHAIDANSYDIDIRIIDEGRHDLRSMIEVVELEGTEREVVIGHLRLSAALVDHPPVYPALGYRLDGPAGSVVVSGDTAASDSLVALAEGCDILVHEVINTALIAPHHAGSVNTDWKKLRAHLVKSHTDVTEVGSVAARARVGTLVLSHKVPGATFDGSDWETPIRAHYSGTVILGQDLMRIPVGARMPAAQS
ncbi:MBL fold metallo-hydrolase [Salinibacterium sp. SYSU T00001]|uniref:MBL fold metallo-hydrolase n=1 Tax=Homoserinimonas sedimenticola TaxID=2986805 RepID=UPI00223592EA|nr:MBL fold metallo-hydrolase [Salinibacterium sedimenticola]MCW4384626.1 MBL fold metallo-hydrolase [Salinibacterium sedimenticola]